MKLLFSCCERFRLYIVASCLSRGTRTAPPDDAMPLLIFQALLRDATTARRHDYGFIALRAMRAFISLLHRSNVVASDLNIIEFREAEGLWACRAIEMLFHFPFFSTSVL